MRQNTFCLGTLVLALAAGCGPSGDTGAGHGPSTSESVAATSGHTPTWTDQPASAAHAPHDHDKAAPAALPPATHPPDNVVQAFLIALREGNDHVAAGLLTRTAREETARQGLTVQPPGTPSARFEIGQVDYVDAQRHGAHVTSVWTEDDDAGAPVSYEIVWALRREPDGWRIAGMATSIVDGEPPVFLNFEDPANMLKRWEEAERIARQPGDPSSENVQR